MGEKIEIWGDQVNGCAQIRIVNKGEKISESAMKSNLDGYITESSRGTKGEKGHGFGLLITKIMTDSIKAELKLENLPDGKIAVTIKIPLAEKTLKLAS